MHLDDELLERYAIGTMAENQTGAVEEHLLLCHECQDRLADMDGYIHAFRAASRKLAAETPSERWYQRIWRVPRMVWVPVLASAALVVLVVRVPLTEKQRQSQVVELWSKRSAENTAAAKAGSPLELKLATEGLGSGRSYRVEIADSAGKEVWSGVVTWQKDVATVQVPRSFSSGNYWVRLYDSAPEPELLREYALSIR